MVTGKTPADPPSRRAPSRASGGASWTASLEKSAYTAGKAYGLP